MWLECKRIDVAGVQEGTVNVAGVQEGTVNVDGVQEKRCGWSAIW